MAQTWRDLLFAHWPLSPDQLRRLVPPPLSLDTFDDQAWLGVIAFRISDIHLHGLPRLPGVDAFPEVNLRTYVSLEGRPGVLFLSLHCPNRLGMALARPWFRLPYRYANVSLSDVGGGLHFASRSPEHADFDVTYKYKKCPAYKEHQTTELEAWLTERYSYYSVARNGAVYRCDIAHPHWRLARAEACIRANTLSSSFALELPRSQPLLNVAEDVEAHIWPLRRVA